jgi:MATE family multidrug resistance protein
MFYFFGDPLCALFTDDPRVHAAAVEYAVILSASQLFVAWEALEEGVLAGAGDTRILFSINAPLNLLRVPLAWLFAFPLGFGAAGIWWTINATCIAKALIKGWVALRGRWVSIEP